MKKILIPLCVLAVLLVPVEALFFNIPAFCFVLAAIILTAADVVFLIKFSKKKSEKICFISLNAVISLLLIIYTFFYPYFGSTVFKLHPKYYVENPHETVTSKEAQADLDFVLKNLKHIHIGMYKKNSEIYKNVLTAYEKASDYIQQKRELTVLELCQQIESMLSVIGDGHTYAHLNYSTSQHYYKKVQSHNINGDNFYGINGKSYEDLLKEKKALYSYEKESWALKDMANHSITLEGLEYMNIDYSNGVTYLFETADGTLFEEQAQSSDFLTYDEYMKYNGNTNNTNSSQPPFCYYSINEEKSLALLTLTSCRNNQEYKDTINKMFTEIKEKGIKNLGIDVRNNGGGNSLVINSLFKYLNISTFKESGSKKRWGPLIVDSAIPTKKNKQIKDLVFDGNVYILSSNSSFSSAMMFVQFIKDNGVGKVIGEAPGNDPNGFGEVVHFDVPNSHLFVQISRKKFKRINQDTDEVYVEPDIPCAPADAVEVLENLL